ncbi:unnamed protein product [Candida verbasci]|uniref:Uncharacterized protein n=1 Tax=Candida verbasci TaxID=1227364 RepID=A0A9W4TQX3_9ASCO|nr:unnamed protein product [Candida verbasci]
MPHPGRPKGRMNKKTQQALAQSHAETMARQQQLAQQQSRIGTGINTAIAYQQQQNILPHLRPQHQQFQHQQAAQQAHAQHILQQQAAAQQAAQAQAQVAQHHHHQQQQLQQNSLKEETGVQLHDEADLISFRNDALYRYTTNHEYIENITSKLIHTNKIIPPSLYPNISKRQESEYDDLKPEDVYFGDLGLMKDVDMRLKKKLSIMHTEDDPNYKAYLFDIDNYKFQKDKVRKLSDIQQENNLSLETAKMLEEDLNAILQESKEKYKRTLKTYPPTRMCTVSIKTINPNYKIDVAPKDYDPRKLNPMNNQNNNNNHNGNHINGGLSSEIDNFANNLDPANVNDMNSIFQFDNDDDDDDDDDHMNGLDNDQPPFDLNLDNLESNNNNNGNGISQGEYVKTNAYDTSGSNTEITGSLSDNLINKENPEKNNHQLQTTNQQQRPENNNADLKDNDSAVRAVAEEEAKRDTQKPPSPSPPASPPTEKEMNNDGQSPRSEPPIVQSVSGTNQTNSHQQSQNYPQQVNQSQDADQQEQAIMDNLFNDNVNEMDPSAIVNDDIDDLYNFDGNGDDNLMNHTDFEQDFLNQINQGMD